MRRLKLIKGLGFLEILSLGISLIMSSGIFLIPLIAAKEYGVFSILGWVLGSIFAILMGLTLSELAVKMPKEGGPYAYVHKAFGNTIGFLTGWIFWFSYWITISVEILALSFFLRPFFPEVNSLIRLSISIVLFLIITFINYLGIKISGEVEDILTFLKVATLIVFIVAGFFAFKQQNLFPLMPSDKSLISIISGSTILALYAYTGFEIITVPEEEVKNAKKAIRKALVFSINTTHLLFILVVFTLLGIMHWSNYGNYLSIAGVAKDVLGYNIGTIVAVGGIMAVLGSINAVVLGSSRVALSMAEDNLFPKFFDHVNEKHKTPDYALIAQTILAILLVILLPNFELLARFTVMLTLFVYLICSLSVLKLIKSPNNKMLILETRLTPIIVALLSVLLLFMFEISLWMTFAGLMVIGYMFYLLERRS